VRVRPSEGGENDFTNARKALAPAVAVAAQAEAFRMERGHGKLNLGALACGSGPLRGNDIIGHGAGILAAARR
jgi:hypothetical protein